MGFLKRIITLFIVMISCLLIKETWNSNSAIDSTSNDQIKNGEILNTEFYNQHAYSEAILKDDTPFIKKTKTMKFKSSRLQNTNDDEQKNKDGFSYKKRVKRDDEKVDFSQLEKNVKRMSRKIFLSYIRMLSRNQVKDTECFANSTFAIENPAIRNNLNICPYFVDFYRNYKHYNSFVNCRSNYDNEEYAVIYDLFFYIRRLIKECKIDTSNPNLCSQLIINILRQTAKCKCLQKIKDVSENDDDVLECCQNQAELRYFLQYELSDISYLDGYNDLNFCKKNHKNVKEVYDELILGKRKDDSEETSDEKFFDDFPDETYSNQTEKNQQFNSNETRIDGETDKIAELNTNVTNVNPRKNKEFNSTTENIVHSQKETRFSNETTSKELYVYISTSTTVDSTTSERNHVPLEKITVTPDLISSKKNEDFITNNTNLPSEEMSGDILMDEPLFDSNVNESIKETSIEKEETTTEYTNITEVEGTMNSSHSTPKLSRNDFNITYDGLKPEEIKVLNPIQSFSQFISSTMPMSTNNGNTLKKTRNTIDQTKNDSLTVISENPKSQTSNIGKDSNDQSNYDSGSPEYIEYEEEDVHSEDNPDSDTEENNEDFKVENPLISKKQNDSSRNFMDRAPTSTEKMLLFTESKEDTNANKTNNNPNIVDDETITTITPDLGESKLLIENDLTNAFTLVSSTEKMNDNFTDSLTTETEMQNQGKADAKNDSLIDYTSNSAESYFKMKEKIALPFLLLGHLANQRIN